MRRPVSQRAPLPFEGEARGRKGLILAGSTSLRLPKKPPPSGPLPPPGRREKPLQPEMGYNSLANFYIEKKIGRGQFSEVYRAKYLLDNTAVALKKVQIFDLMDAKARQDCIKEIDLLKCLPSSNRLRQAAASANWRVNDRSNKPERPGDQRRLAALFCLAISSDQLTQTHRTVPAATRMPSTSPAVFRMLLVYFRARLFG
ncbi:serine/threonine-protein kinase Nek7 isoform X1 [Tachysurus ichikawai]